jgi:hypothetical protein
VKIAGENETTKRFLLIVIVSYIAQTKIIVFSVLPSGLKVCYRHDHTMTTL